MANRAQLVSYRTSDLSIAAFLQENGFQILNVERNNGRCTFVFNDSQSQAEDTVCQFYNGAVIAAIRFSDRLRNLKTVVMRGWAE